MHDHSYYKFLESISDVDIEGRKVSSNRDTPGQRSVYITPGDTERETYRLSTFLRFPRESPIDPREFAVNGFFYTGFRDRVKCFSCGQCSENWQIGDNVPSTQWHDPNCDFINERETNNVPLLAVVRGNSTSPRNTKLVSRLNNSFGNSLPLDQSHNQRAGSEQSNSFSSTPSLSHQNPSTSQIFNPPSTVLKHSRRSNITTSSLASSTTNSINSSPNSFRTLFPCLHSVNPHMRSREARLQTFLDHSTVWPAHRIRTSPQQIVDAGFFYLGNRDRVKCWYCNGGLQNWERDDVPWEEHAKWFPMCEYVLQQKGSGYVRDIVSRFPNLRRPILSNAASGQAVGPLLQSLRISASPQEITESTAASEILSQPIITDPRKEMLERNQKTDYEMKSSDDVLQAKMMGFDDDVIKLVLKRKYETHSRFFTNFQDLLEAILTVTQNQLTNEITREVHRESQTVPQQSVSTSSASSSLAFQELRKLEESRVCKKCRKEDACVVFIPCGHLVCCVKCADESNTCPICKESVKEKVRSFIS